MMGNYNKTEDKGLIFVLKDLKNNLKCCEVVVTSCIALLVFVCLLCLYSSNNLCLCLNIEQVLMPIILALFGVSVASVSILYSLNEDTKTKLNQIANDYKRPYDTLIAIFIFEAFIDCIVLLLYLGNLFWKNDYILIIEFSITVWCITWGINMILHLFTVRTFNK